MDLTGSTRMRTSLFHTFLAGTAVLALTLAACSKTYRPSTEAAAADRAGDRADAMALARTAAASEHFRPPSPPAPPQPVSAHPMPRPFPAPAPAPPQNTERYDEREDNPVR